MKKNKLTKLLFTDPDGFYPYTTCDLISNFLFNIFTGIFIIIVVSPVLMFHPDIPFFPKGNATTVKEILGKIASISLLLSCAISSILVAVYIGSKIDTNKFNTISNIISTIKDKTCYKITWRD